MKVDPESMPSWPGSSKPLALEEIKGTIQATDDNITGDALIDTAVVNGQSKHRIKRQHDRQRVEHHVNDILNQHRRKHEATHHRSKSMT